MRIKRENICFKSLPTACTDENNNCDFQQQFIQKQQSGDSKKMAATYKEIKANYCRPIAAATEPQNQ